MPTLQQQTNRQRITPQTDVALYIHVPFCLKKCPYCAFYKKAWTAQNQTRYITALTTEMKAIESAYGRLPVHTVFLGGGTPSKLDPDALTEIFSGIASHFQLNTPCEITIEMNPETVTPDLMALLAKLGVNRVSLGVQSFEPNTLEFLGRWHTPETIETAIRHIQNSPITNFNLDLIFGIPNSDTKQITHSVEKALSFNPSHLSTYNLTIEDNTPFARRKIQNIASEIERAQFEVIIHLAKDAGFRHYEISNFAKPGFECQHNLAYWQLTPYLGIGPSACSFFHDTHFQNPADLDEYCKDPTPQLLADPTLTTDPQTIQNDYIMTHLRLLDGIPLADYHRRFGTKFMSDYHTPLNRLIDQQLLEYTGESVKITPKGFFVVDSITTEFLV